MRPAVKRRSILQPIQAAPRAAVRGIHVRSRGHPPGWQSPAAQLRGRRRSAGQGGKKSGNRSALENAAVLPCLLPAPLASLMLAHTGLVPGPHPTSQACLHAGGVHHAVAFALLDGGACREKGGKLSLCEGEPSCFGGSTTNHARPLEQATPLDDLLTGSTPSSSPRHE